MKNNFSFWNWNFQQTARKSKYLALKLVAAVLIVLATTVTATATVVVTAPTGGTNICTNNAADGAAPAYTSIGSIVIEEGDATEFGNNNNGTWSCSITLAPPAGWEFNPSGTTTYSVRNGRNANSITGVLTSNSLTLTINGDGRNKTDRITITGLQVRATVSSSDAAFSANGYIYCSAYSTILAGAITTGAAGTSFGNLSQSPQQITGTTSLCVVSPVTLSNLTAGGTWSSGNTAIATVNSSTGVVTGAGVGTTTISYTAAGCATWKTVTVHARPSVDAAVTPSTQCVGNVVTFNATPAEGSGTYTSYSWSGPNGFSATGQSTNRTLTALADEGTYSVTVTDDRGCTSVLPGTATLTISSPAVTGTFTVCASAATTLSNTGGAGTWSSSNPAIASVGAATGVVTAGASAGTATITFTLTSTGCRATQVVTVMGSPAAISGSSSVCAGSSITLTNTTANGIWSSSNTGVATVEPATGVVAGITGGTTIITYSTGCGTAATRIVTVAGAPIGGAETVCTTSNTTLTNLTGGGTWMSSNTAVGTIGSTTGVLRGIATGTTTITYTVSGCTITKVMSVTTTPAAISGTVSVCNGSVTTLSNTVQYGTWSSTATGVATVGTSGVVTSVSTGTAVISYTTGCGTAQGIVVTVNTTPVAIAGTTTICRATTTTLTNATGGGTWTSSATGIATIGSSTGVMTGVAAGTATISYSLSTGCRATTVITINQAPVAITGTLKICESSISSLSNATGSGDWSSSNTAIALVGPSGDLNGISAGTATVSYTLSNGCFTSSIATINAVPVLSGSFSLCLGTGTTLSSSIAGGTWSSDETTVATIGASNGVVTTQGVGQTSIAYLTTAGCTTVEELTVNQVPANVTGTFTVCVNAVTTLADATAGGSWISGNAAIATVGSGSGIVTGVSAGTVRITYSMPGNCIATAIVTVNPIPNTITNNSALCTGGSTITFANSTGGGTWQSSTASVATVGSATGTVSPVATGTSTISYRLTSTGCFITTVATVNTVPAAIGGNAVMCAGGASVTLTNAVFGGVWSSSNAAVASVGSSTGLVTPIAAGTATISYASGAGAACLTTIAVTVNAAPAAIGGNTAICVGGSTVTLTNSTAGGTWSSSNAAVVSINSSTGVMAPVVAGNATISYTMGAGAGCVATVNATVNGAPGAITGNAVMCAGGSTVSLSNSAAGGVWTSSNSGIVSVGASSGVMTPVAGGNATISYATGSGAACLATVIATVTPTAPTSVSATASANPICAGGDLTLTGVATGATSWSWSGPNGFSSAAQSPTVSSITTAGAGVYTLSATNVCGTTQAVTAVVTVTPTVPTSVSATASANPICAGSDLTLTGVATGATSWSWSGPNGFSSAAQSPTVTSITTAGAGVYTLSATNVCGTTQAVTAVVTVTPTAPTSVSATASANPICAGSDLTLTGVATGATSWLWSGPNGVSSAAQSPTVSSITMAGAGVYTLSATNVCGTTTAATAVVTVTPTVPTSVSATASANPICAGGDLTLTGVATGATSWSWSGPNGFSSAVQSPTVSSITTAGAGVYTLSATNVCGTTQAVTAVVTVTPTAPTSVSATASANPICAGGDLSLTGVATGATSWSWSGPNGFSSAAQSPTVSSITTAGAGVYTLSATNVCGTTTAATAVVTVTPTAPTSVSATASANPICAGSDLSLTGVATGATSWSWSGPNGFSSAAQSPTVSSITTAGAGVYTLSATNVCGTTQAVTAVVTVTPTVPTSVSATAVANPICAGGDLTLTGVATGATSWSWSGPNGFSSASQSPTVSSITTAGAGVYTLSATNVCGATQAVTAVVTVTPTAPTSVSATASANPVCAGGDLTLTGVATGATSWSWSGPNGFSSAAQSPTVSSITAAGAGVYTLSATNVCGTTTATTAVVTVTPTVPTSVSATASANPICAGDDLTLTGVATEATSWSWSGPNGFSSAAQSPTVSSITTAGAGVYTLSATNVCGTTTATTAVVTVTPTVPTSVSATASANPICAGGDLSLTGVATGATSWSWSGPNGFSSAAQSPTVSSITTAGAGVYTLSATNVCGTTQAATAVVTVTPTVPTSVSATASANPICAGGNLTLTGVATGATSWSWSGPNGFSSAAQSPTVSSITTAGAGVYTLSATNVCGTTQAVTAVVTVTPTAPTSVSATASANPICAGGDLSLTGVATGATSWSWSGPNGFSSAAQSPTVSSITTAGAGVYTLSATNVCGTTTATTAVVTVTPTVPTSVSATASANPICAGGDLTLTGVATGATSWSWSGPNGFSSAAQSPTVSSITTAGAGVYTLSATNVCGTTTATTTVVTVTPTVPTSVSATASANPICAGSDLTLTGVAIGATSWSWSGPNGFSSAAQSPTVSSITTAGAGVYTLSATNVCGTAQAVTAVVAVTPTVPTSVSATASANPICAGGDLTLTGVATGATSWSWSGPNGFSSASQSPTVSSITTAGAGVYTLSATNVCGTTAATTAVVTVTPTVPTSVSATASANPICAGGDLSLTGVATGVTSWSWSGPNGFSSAAQSPTVSSVTTAGAGVYTLSASNVCGATTATTAVVTVTPTVPTSVSATASANPICAGGDLTLTGVATGATSWSWSGPNGFSSAAQSPTVTSITTAGAGVYTLFATNVCGTTQAVTAVVTVTPTAPTSVSATASANPVCAGGDLTLTGVATGATSWSWSGPNGFSSAAQSPTVSSITTAGAGIYTLSATNVCGTTTATTAVVTVTPTVPTSVSATASANPICAGGDLSLTGVATGATSWSWSGPNGFSSAAQSPTVSSITTAGAGVYTLSTTNVCGTTTATTAVVTVTPTVPTSVSATASANPICAGSDLTLTGVATGATSWSWSGPNGFSSAAQSSTVSSITTAGAGVYTLSATNVCGTTTATTAVVTVTPTVPTSVSATASANPICAGSDLSLTGVATGATSWSWSGPNGFSSAAQSPTVSSITTAGAGVYTLSATNVCGTTTAATAVVTVTPTAPTSVSATASANPICAGGDLSLMGVATGATSWSWSGPNGFSSAAQSPTVSSITTAGAGVYTLFATNVCGTTQAVTAVVTVTATAPTSVSATASANPICAGGDLSLTGVATGATSWSWSGPNGFSSAAQSSTVSSITTAGAGVYTLSATNVCGTTQAVTAVVTVTPTAPTSVSATASANPICAGSDLTLTGVATEATSWSWSGPNGFSSAAQSPTVSSITTAGAGVYTLSATNVCGTTQAVTAVVTVTATAPTSVSATASANPICGGSDLTLTGVATGATSWSWSGPNGFSSAAQSPTVSSITTAGAGVYTLSATNVCGTTTATTAVVTVTPTAPTSVSATASANPICAGGDLSLMGVATGATSWLWSGPNGFSSAAQSPTVSSITTAGAGVYTLSATNVCGTTTATTAVVTVTPTAPTSVSATASANPICAGGDLSLTGVATGATSWSWSGPNGFSSAAQSPTVSSITTAGAGVYTLSATNVCGTTTATTAVVTVTPTVPTSVSATASANPICAGSDVTLTGVATGATSWSWSGPNGFSSAAQSPTVSSITTAGAGVYTLSATNVCGTTQAVTAVVTVTATAPTSVSATASANPICAGSDLTLTGVATGATSWSWSGPNGFSSAAQSPIVFSITTAGAGVYTLSATNVCGTTTATTAVVTVNTVPTSVVASASSSAVCSGDDLTVTASVTGGSSLTYQWAGPNGFSSTLLSPAAFSATGASAGVYTFTATAAGCSGSTATTTVSVNALPASVVVSGSGTYCGNATLTAANGGDGTIYFQGTTAGGVLTATPSVSEVVVSSGTYYFRARSTEGCWSTEGSATVVINALATPITGTAAICSSSTTTLGNEATGGTWTSSNTAVVTVSSGSGIISGVSAGTAIVTYTLGTGCATTRIVTVYGMPSAIAGSLTVCEGRTTTLSNTVFGGTWTAGDPSIASVAAGSGIVSGVAAGTTVVTYMLNTGCYTTSVLTVNASPSAITGTAQFCAGRTSTLTNGVGEGAWSSTNPVIATVGSSSGIVLGLLEGNATIVYTLPSGCTATRVVTINLQPSAIVAPATLCEGASTTLTNGISGGTWSSSNASVFTITTGGAMAGIAAGTGTITYTISNGCFRTRAITVNPLPSLIGGSATLCIGSTGTLTNSLPGGSWSSSLASVATIGSTTGIITGVSAGVTNISYSVSGCLRTTAVTVSPLPAVISGTPVVCSNAVTTLSSSTAGGTWSSSNTAVATVGTSGVITGVSAGTTQISYTVATGCSRSVTVTVNQAPAAITGSATVCQGSSITLESATAGGTWTASSTVVAIGSSTGIVTGVNAATVIITYTVANGCRATRITTVNAVPTVIGGNATVCSGSTTTLNSLTTGGTWSSSDIASAVISSGTGVMTGIAGGNPIITYTLPSGCYLTKVATVHPMGSIVGASTLCAGSSASLSNSATGGVWSSSSASIATIGSSSGVLNAVSAGVCTISYFIAATGCRATISVTVNPNADIAGAATTCVGQSTTLSNATAGGTWSSSDAAVANIHSATGVLTGAGAGTAVISYSLPSGCFRTRVVTVNAFPAGITGVTNLCAGSTTTLANAVPGGSWSSSSTAVASVGSATGIVNAITAGSATITYSLGVGCYAVEVITVRPIQPITGVLTACQGMTTTLASASAGGTWQSSDSSIASIGSTNGVVSGIALGTAFVSYSIPTGCSRVVTVTVNSLPATISGATNLCAGIAGTLSNTVSGGTWTSSNAAIVTVGGTTGVATGVAAGTATITYLTGLACYTTAVVTVAATPANTGVLKACIGTTTTLSNIVTGGTWSTGNAAVADVNAATGEVTGIAAGTAPITYSPATGCARVSVVTINPLPGAVSGVLSVCIGAVTTVINATPGGVSWTSSNTSVATVGATTGIVTGVAEGTTLLTYTINTGCYVTRELTVNPVPAAITGSALLCAAGSTTLTNSVAGGSWISSNSAIAAIGSGTGVITGVNAGTANISYVLPTGCRATITATVSPASAITGATTVCAGAVTTMSNATGGGTWSSSDVAVASIGSSNGVLTGITAGTAVLSYTTATGCVRTATVTVNASPGVISGASTVCQGTTATLTNATAGGTWQLNNATIASINSSTGVISGVVPGSVTVSYTLATGCRAISAVTVSANPAAITGTNTVCQGSATTLANATAGGSWMSSNAATATIGSATGIVSAIAAGTASISYTLPGGCQRLTTVYVNPVPASISGPSAVCAGSTSTVSNTSTGGVSWTSSNTAVATVGVVTGIVTGVAAGTTVLTYTLGTGCNTTAVITVNAVPAAITGASVLCPGGSATLSSTTSGGSWSSSGITIGSASGIVTAVASGVSTITYALATGCYRTATLAVHTTYPIEGSTMVCVGSTGTLHSTLAGGTWVSANTTIGTIGSATGYISGLSAGTSSITYTDINGCPTAPVVTVNATPDAGAVSGSTAIYTGSVTTLSATFAGGTWTSGNNSIATVDSASGVVTGVANGNAVISYSFDNGCGLAVTTHTVTISACGGAAGSITGSAAVCAGSVTTLASTVSGGTWSSGDATKATIDAATGVASGVAAGTANVTYTISSGCTAVAVLTVNPVPSSITGSTALCAGQTATMANATAGGTWSSGTISVAAIGSATGIVNGVAAGVAIVTYHSAIGCIATRAVTVNALPASITGASSVCEGGIVTLASATSGGVWSGSNPSILSVNSASGVVSGIAAGDAVVSYTSATGCTVTVSVTVNSMPASIGGPATVCAGAVITLSNTLAGGTWSSSNAAVATVGSATGLVSGLSAGTSVITYETTGGCVVTRTVTVSAGPAAISGTLAVCEGGSATLSNATSGGTWASANASVATINAVNGVITGVSTGTATISYLTSGGCVATNIVTVIALPASITGSLSVCTGSAATLANATAGGSWSVSNSAVASIGSTGAITGVSAGTTTVTYMLPSGCFASATATVNALPGSITGTAAICAGSTTTLANTTSGGTWSSSNNSVATVASGVVSGVGAGVINITYALSSGCAAVMPFTVNALPAAITGPAAICTGGSASLENSVSSGTWTSGNTLVATVDATTGVAEGIAAGTVAISYTLPSGCASATVLTVNAAPAAISGGETVCTGSTLVLSSGSAGGTWLSSNTSVAIIGSATGLLTAVTSGVTTVTYTLPIGCSTAVAITVNELPAAITGTPVLCAGSSAAMSSATTGGTWSTMNAAIATIGSATGVVTGMATGTAGIVYTLPTGCQVAATVTVNSSPGGFTGSPMVCIGRTATVYNLTGGGTWASSNTAIATVGSSSAGVVTGISAGTAVLTYTISNGCYRTLVATVNELPSAITGPSLVCVGQTALYENTTSGGAWTTSNGTVATIGSASGVVTAVSAGTVRVTYTAGVGCAASVVVTVSPLPSALSGTAVACTGLTTTLISSTPGGAWSSSNAATATVSGGIVTALAPGIATITYTLGTGCFRTVAVTVNESPSAITGTAVLCQGGSSTLANAVAGGTWSSSRTSYATINATSGIVTGVAAGTSNITYTTAAGCRTTRIVTVLGNPAVISGTSTVCENALTTLSCATAGGTWSSSDVAIATVGTTGVVAGVSTGTVNITYTLASGCYRSAVITVNLSPAAITGIAPVCAGSTITLANTVAGGSWSASSAIATIGSASGVLTGVSAGTLNISYTLANGCRARSVATVNVLPGAISGVSVLCAGATGTLGNIVSGGAWSTSDSSVLTVNSSGVISAVSGGVATVTYTMASGCLRTKSVTVNPLLPITGPASVCVGSTATLENAVAGGTWTISLSSYATIGAATGVVNGIFNGVATVTYTLPTLCRVVRPLTVNANPALTGTASTCAGLTTTLGSTAAGGAWSSSDAGVATVGSSTGIVTGVANGTAEISYTLATGCVRTREVTINAFPSAIGGIGTLCAGSTLSLSNAVSGGTWSSSSSVATVNSSGVVTGVSSGVATITYSLGAGCSVTGVVTVTPLQPITGTASACAGMTTTLSNATTGGTWSSSNTAVATVGTSGVVSAVSVGTAVITYTAPSGCARTIIVTVNPVPTVITGATTICAGLTATLSSDEAGGTWTSSNGGVASAGSASGIITGIAGGTATITYTAGLGCRVTAIVSVNGLAATTGTAKACVGSATTLANSTPGGVWSSSNAAVATVDAAGVVDGITAGTAVISYTPSSGCYRTVVVTINPIPAAIGGTLTACVGGTGLVTNTTTGGVSYISSDPSVATVGATSGIVTGVSAGTTIITYTVNTGCSTTAEFTVNPAPAAITGTAGLCVGGVATLGNASAGGTWACSNAGRANVVAATGVVTGISSGTANVTYTLPTGCRTSAQITVNASAAITGTPLVCTGNAVTLGNAIAGGTWESADAAVASIGGGTGVVSGLAAGTTQVSYTTAAGCVRTAVVTVNESPAAIAGSLSICLGAPVTLTNTTAGGTWKAGNASILSVGTMTGAVAGVATGTSAVTYTAANGCRSQAVVTVNNAVSAGVISGSTSIAVSGSTTLSSTVAGGMWASSDAAVAAVGSATGIVTGATPGNAVITYTVTNGCGTAIAVATVTVVASKQAAGGSLSDEFVLRLNAYPNPTTGVVTLRTWADGRVTIYATDGRAVYDNFVAQGDNLLTLSSELANGVYLCRFVDNAGKTATISLIYSR